MATDAQLEAAFTRGTGRSTRPSDRVPTLRATIESARSGWPQVDASEERFAEALGAAVGEHDEPWDELEQLCCADVWLATAACDGDAAGIRAIDRLLGALRPTVARVGADRATIDELLQQVRVRLLTGSEARPPRIRSYRGRGSLRSWLKVIVVRDAIRAQRSGRAHDDDADALDVLMDPGDDPELTAMRGKYREAFRAAFEHALSELEPRDRNVLRHHLAEGLTIDDLAGLYRVHRATTARWLARIREALFVGTRTRLMQGLGVGEHEVDSVIRMIRSRLDTSIVSRLDDAG